MIFARNVCWENAQTTIDEERHHDRAMGATYYLHRPQMRNSPLEETQWCNLLTMQPEQSSGVGSKLGRAPPFERHDNGVAIQLLCARNRNFTSIIFRRNVGKGQIKNSIYVSFLAPLYEVSVD